MSAKRRVIAKRDRDKWGVYDTVKGSWPQQIPGYGVVAQKHATEAAAEAEARHLDDFYRAGPTS